MNCRLFKKEMNRKLMSLNGLDVIASRISDHHPLIHEGVLFWNIMMQGDLRKNGGGFNNGFGITETEVQYIKRLQKIVKVIAELIYRNPSLEAIVICEGPVKKEHVELFFQSLNQYEWMKRFLQHGDFFKPNNAEFPNWGLLMLADQRFDIKPANDDFFEDKELKKPLMNRLQLWHLREASNDKWILQAHLPFGGDELKENANEFSTVGKAYALLLQKILKKYSNKEFFIACDFNFNPNLISHWKERVLDEIPVNNSILFKEHKPTPTVDGILVSDLLKQKLTQATPLFDLFRILKKERQFFKKVNDDYLEENRHKNDMTQNEYDKAWGLVVCR